MKLRDAVNQVLNNLSKLTRLDNLDDGFISEIHREAHSVGETGLLFFKRKDFYSFETPDSLELGRNPDHGTYSIELTLIEGARGFELPFDFSGLNFGLAPDILSLSDGGSFWFTNQSVGRSYDLHLVVNDGYHSSLLWMSTPSKEELRQGVNEASVGRIKFVDGSMEVARANLPSRYQRMDEDQTVSSLLEVNKMFSDFYARLAGRPGEKHESFPAYVDEFFENQLESAGPSVVE